jgi:3-hydroxyacyl-CoA dehydrogenase
MYPNRTAALTAHRSLSWPARLPIEQGLLEEDRYANQTKAPSEARGAIHVFFAERESRKVEGLPPGAGPKIAQAGVVGAGTMGGGIAIAFANAGVPVTLLDATRRAWHGLWRRRRDLREHGEARPHRCRGEGAPPGLISGTLTYADLPPPT